MDRVFPPLETWQKLQHRCNFGVLRVPEGRRAGGAAACDLNVADLDFSPAQREADKSVPGKIRPTTPSPPRPRPPRIHRLRLVSATLNRPHSPAALAVQSPHPCPTAWSLPNRKYSAGSARTPRWS